MSTNEPIVRRYAFALYPTRAEDSLLHEQRRMMADIWNAMKQRCEDVHRRNSQKAKEDRRSLTFFDLTNEITILRRECPEWQAMPTVTLHRVAKQLTDAFAAFFRRCRNGEAPGYPRWRNREKVKSIPLGTGTRTRNGKQTWRTGWRFVQRDDNPLSWSLYFGDADLKDRTTWIHARGRFPGDINEYNNADIIWRDGKWSLSVCVEKNGERDSGVEPSTVRLNTIDCFATVNGEPQFPDGLVDAQMLDERVDELKAERDKRWQRPPRHDAPERPEWDDASLEISRLQARAARIRRNAVHVWTTRVVRRASDLTIIAPASIKETTKSPHGDEKHWGAETGTVSAINRHILNQAPALAIAMLQYKAAEAGIRCDVVTDEAPESAIGQQFVAVGKKLRRSVRMVRKAGKET